VDDVEFYHDQGGVTLGKANLSDSVKKNICGKVTRELVPGTLEVHHMKGYGAVEMGVHAFITLEMTTKRVSARESLFICGNTKTEHGRLRESSATIITLPPNDSIALVFVDCETASLSKKVNLLRKRSCPPHLQTGLSTYSNTGPATWRLIWPFAVCPYYH
jgi:hypothetical protein